MSIQVDDEKIRRMSVTLPNLKDMANDAARASDIEKNMSLWQSLKLYPKAVGWSVFLSMAIIMEVSFLLRQTYRDKFFDMFRDSTSS